MIPGTPVLCRGVPVFTESPNNWNPKRSLELRGRIAPTKAKGLVRVRLTQPYYNQWEMWFYPCDVEERK